MRMLRDMHLAAIDEANCREFVKVAVCLALSKGNFSDAKLLARTGRLDLGPTALGIIQKADAGAVYGNTWGAEISGDFATLVISFVESLANGNGAFDVIAQSAMNVPQKSRIVITVTPPTGSTPAEGAVKPPSDMEFDALAMQARKAVAVSVHSKELAELGGVAAMAHIERELRKEVQRQTDKTMVSVLNTLTGAGTASSGSILTDLQTCLLAIDSGDQSTFFGLIDPRSAKILATLQNADGSAAFPQMTPRGGVIGGVTLIANDQMIDTNSPTTGDLLVLDASGLCVSPGTLDLSGTDQANLAMDGGNTANYSLWQRNAIAAICHRHFGLEALRANIAARIHSADYTAQDA